MTLQFVLLAAALVIPAVLIAAAPQRWIGRAMVAWVFSPMVAYLGVILWETATRPATIISVQNVVLGFSLLSAILIVPWTVACATGFAIGFGLRKLTRRAVHSARPSDTGAAAPRDLATRPSSVPAVLPLAAQVSSDAGEWRQAHIGFENDGLQIDGLDVWALDWRDLKAAPLHLAHPAYPHEMHQFRIQEIGQGQQVTRFAASELSNGVWGFYVPRLGRVESSAITADGALRFEQRRGGETEDPADSLASWAVLIDAKTGRVLADCRDWLESRIVANADGSLFLRLRQEDGETLFRIEPVVQTFRNLGENSPPLPLEKLAETIDHDRQARSRPAPGTVYRRISPDGTVRVDSEAVEWGNSHWVHTPRVIDLVSGQVVLDLWNTDWDATISWVGPRRVSLDFSRYHFSGDLTIELDLINASYRITREPGGRDELPTGPLAEAAAAMEASGRRVAAFASRQNADRQVRRVDRRPGPLAAWRTALQIAIVAAALIGGATWLSTGLAPRTASHPNLLRPIPSPDISQPAASPQQAAAMPSHAGASFQ